jgi:hypothetical protein
LGKAKDPHQKLESLERWSARATLLILLGIAVEAVAVFQFPHALEERLWSLAANGAIGIGLIVEYFVIGRAIVATRQAEAESNQKIAKANAEAAKANERALEIQLLLDEEIKKNAWRRLNKQRHDDIADPVRNGLPVKITVSFDGNDPEASVFASELIKAFEDGGAVVNPQPSAVFVGQMPLFGIVAQARSGFDASSIEDAVSGAAEVDKNESLKSYPELYHSDLFLCVGHKPKAF